MATKTAAIDKVAALTAKVASMTEEQKIARIEQIYAMRQPEANEDTDLEFSIITAHSKLGETLIAKVAAMTPAERVERREQIADAAPSHAGDLEFSILISRYFENGEPH